MPWLNDLVLDIQPNPPILIRQYEMPNFASGKNLFFLTMPSKPSTTTG